MTLLAEETSTPAHELNAFDALLPALARALDVRDAFHQLSAIASRIVPHDEASLALLTDDRSHFRLYASTHRDPTLVCREDSCVLQEPIVARVLDTVPGPERGLRSGVCHAGAHRRRNCRRLRLVLAASAGVLAGASRPRRAARRVRGRRACASTARGRGSSRRRRARTHGEHRELGRVAADDLGSPRHPHGLPPGVGDREQSAAARSDVDDVSQRRADSGRG